MRRHYRQDWQLTAPRDRYQAFPHTSQKTKNPAAAGSGEQFREGIGGSGGIRIINKILYFIEKYGQLVRQFVQQKV